MDKPRILIVEDEFIVAQDIEQRLIKSGYEVAAVAYSGEEAVEKARETRPDLVLMDIRLGGKMGGVEAAAQIRAELDAPVIYLTAYADEPTIQQAKLTQPNGYILKPFSERELRSNIEMALYKHETERKLKESEEWFSTTLKSIGDAVIATDCNGNVTFMNPVSENLTGWMHAEARGKFVTEIFRVIDENTRQAIETPATVALREGKTVDLRSNVLLITKEGAETPIDDSAAPILDDKGEMLGVVLIFKDVTRRKQHEQQIREMQKMEAVGRLAGGIAHDFNNLMTVVMVNSDLLLWQLQAEDPVHIKIEEIKEAGERAAELTKQLLALSRKQILQPKVFDLNREVTGMEKVLGGLIGEQISLATALSPAPCLINADPVQIKQVLLNLVINARDAMSNGGTISVATEIVNLDETFFEGNSDAQQPGGRYALLKVTDTGSGMSAEQQQHIFEPFFTTKALGQGTGLGLATVNGIVKQSGGHIRVKSKPGDGTTFEIYLPFAG